jgi:hypothetical protein
MTKFAFILLAASRAFGADTSWPRVQEIKSDSELRIYKKGSAQPLIAIFDEANEERIVIVIKNEQMAILREDIDRIDAGPPSKTPRKLKGESKVKTNEPDTSPHPESGVPVPTTSYSTGLNVTGGGSKADFETIYRRPPPASK